MGCQILELDQGTPEWHDWRASGIGASEVAALFQESPYMTMRELYLLKKKLIPEYVIFGENDFIFDKGHRAEEKMRAEYFALTGDVFVPKCVVNPAYPGLIASLDGLYESDGVKRIFEAKLVGEEALEFITLTNMPPRHHYLQIQQQLLLSEAEFCLYFAQDLEGGATTITVYPDTETQMEIIQAANLFHEINLQGNVEPPMTKDDFKYTKEDGDFLKLKELQTKKTKLKEDLEQVDEDYKKELAVVYEKYGHHVCHVEMGIKVKKMERRGNIQFMDIPEVVKLGMGYLDTFRKESTTYFQAWFKKPKEN